MGNALAGIRKIGEKTLDVNKEYNKLLEGDGRLLTNMDGFREAALEFEEFNRYTKATPNKNPNSSYMRFWNEQQRRCIEGYHVGYDYIPGYYYYYLNFSPIQLTVELGEEDESTGLIKSERIEGFPKVWDGDYYWYHYLNEAELSGNHGLGLKARGKGFSFKGGAMLTRNYYHFPKSKSYAFAHSQEYLTKDGLLTKAWSNMAFIDEHTPWGKKRHYKDQDMHKRASYQEIINGKKIEKGYLSEIIGVVFKDDADKARGKRGKLILWEELGSFPKALKAWRIALNSMKQSRSVFGLMVGFGTGGEEGVDFEAMDEMFKNPRGYQLHPMTNVLDESLYGTDSTFFFPEQLNREGFYDKNGNSAIKAALKDVYRERDSIIKNTKDPNTIAQTKAESPTKPQEAMLNTTTNNFPIEELAMRRTQLESDPKFIESEWVGDLIAQGKGVIWKRNKNKIPIRQFPLKGHKKDSGRVSSDGAVQIYDPPYKNGHGEIPGGMYIGGIDTYDQDQSVTESLGSIFIMNVLNEKIVAEYTGRPPKADDFYGECRKLLVYYNARANYENDLRGLFSYFKTNNALQYLVKTPDSIRDRIGSTTLKREYGTPGTTAVNKQARSLINNWLRSKCPDNKELYNYERIRSIPLLKELELYNPKKGNYDRISALGMLMIYKQDIAPDKITKEGKPVRRPKLTNNFMTKSYGGNKLKPNIIKSNLKSEEVNGYSGGDFRWLF